MEREEMAIAPRERASGEGVVWITGEVNEQMSFSLDALRQCDGVTGAPFDLRCFSTRRFIRTVGQYKGALLTDLLGRAGLRNEQHSDFKRKIFIAVGHDGYAVTFSWHELFNTPVGKQVIVAYECDGRPLDATDGAPVLFSGADIFAAPRHVNRLERVVVRTVTPD